MSTPIAITGFGSLSAAGATGYGFIEIPSLYVKKDSTDRPIPDRHDPIKTILPEKHCLTFDKNLKCWVGTLPALCKAAIEEIRQENKNYRYLDPTVLYALYTSRISMARAGWKIGDSFGINIGSSRGATQLFEQFHETFLSSGGQNANPRSLPPMSSPSTTLGNISSWVAQDVQNDGPEISHSITCSTAMHALLNGVAWLRSGMCQRFLVGGSEAALTPFTVAQMNAMNVLGRAETGSPYPCRALDLDKTENTMVLGEGAASVCLELGTRENALAYIMGVGYATEKLKHAASISAEADCFQKSMRMALKDADIEAVDAIVMHAPGTVAGDRTEYRAIQKVFGKKIPLLTSNKWKIGHTFGPSGLLSLELAIHMLQTQEFEASPFFLAQATPKRLGCILVNSVGFGGNAVSVIVKSA